MFRLYCGKERNTLGQIIQVIVRIFQPKIPGNATNDGIAISCKVINKLLKVKQFKKENPSFETT